MQTIYRHGDLSLHPIGEVEGQELKHKGSYVLAVGEHTNHKHVITVEKPELMRVIQTPEGLVLELLGEGTITHEEHHAIKVKKGKYLMKHEQEFDYALNETRQVID